MGSVTICVGNLADLADPGCLEFQWGAGPVPRRGFLVRRGERVYAYVNACPHARRPLNWQPGRFLDPSGQHILCTGHGALFEVETGLCVAGPCPGTGLRSLSVRIERGSVLVDTA